MIQTRFKVIKSRAKVLDCDNKKDAIYKREDPRTKIVSALKRIIKNTDTSDMDEEIENGFFCIEDTILTKDLEVIVYGQVVLNFPLDENSIERLIELSTKAKFGRGEATVLDTNVRNTQMIPASQLNINIKPEAFTCLLEEIGKGLYIPKGSSLELHYHNLLIYGPGQFFKKHKDTEKLEGMVATLVIVLPFPHKGGQLVIEHNNRKHLFFGSKNPEIVKCVAFYSDCDHEIKVVTEGYRVAITCNIVLNVQNTSLEENVDEHLDKLVQKYFANGATKFVYQMNHSYSEHSLKWSLLKGEDRVCANALLAVAKKQGRAPCLAFAKLHETFDVEDLYAGDNSSLIDAETELYYWIDEYNFNFTNPLGHLFVDDEEAFFMEKTSDLFEPYEVEESGPTENEGETKEYWYRRACVVLFANKWVSHRSFKRALTELHQLTKEEGKQQVLLEKIKAIGSDFINEHFWVLPHISDMLLDIVMYLNCAKTAEMVLPKLKNVLLNENKIDCLIRLETQFDSPMWNKILDIWENGGYFRNKSATEGISFLNKYIEVAGEQKKSSLFPGILGEAVDEFLEGNKDNRLFKYIYDRTEDRKIEILSHLIKLSLDLEFKELESKLMKYVLSASPSVFPAASKAQLCCKLHEMVKPEQMFPRFTDLVTSTLNDITTLLSQIVDDFHWSIPVSSQCKCERLCTPVLQFFCSKTSTEFVIQGPRKDKVHLYSNFYAYSVEPYKISFDYIKYNTYAVRFKKLPIYKEKQQKLKEDLLSFQRLLQAMDTIKGEVNTEVKLEDIKEEPEELLGY